MCLLLLTGTVVIVTTVVDWYCVDVSTFFG